MIPDFTLSEPTTVQFPATVVGNGVQQACFSVAITDDDIFEATESFSLQLSTSDPQADLTGPSAEVFIQDNDGREAYTETLLYTSCECIQ